MCSEEIGDIERKGWSNVLFKEGLRGEGVHVRVWSVCDQNRTRLC